MSDLIFERGPEATALAAADPFWSAVLRRDPDIDLVLLPPASPPPPIEVPAGTVELSAAGAAAGCAVRVADLWRQLVGDAEPDETRDRWTAGPIPGLVRNEATWTVLGADPVEAMAVVERASATLRTAGWRVLAPPDGMPRVLAGRDAAIGREEADLVFAPATGRLFLQLRSGFQPVVATEVAALLGSAS